MCVRTFRRCILPPSSRCTRYEMSVLTYLCTRRRNTADYKMNRLGVVNLNYGDCNQIKDGISVTGLSLNSYARHQYVTAVLPKIQVFWEVAKNFLSEYLPTFRRVVVPSSAGLNSPISGNTTIIFVTFFSLSLIKFLSNDKHLLHAATANTPSEFKEIPPIS